MQMNEWGETRIAGELKEIPEEANEIEIVDTVERGLPPGISSKSKIKIFQKFWKKIFFYPKSSNVTVDVEVLKTTLGAISESLTSVLPYSIPMPEIPRDFDSISEEALTLLEQEMSQSVRARVQHLCRVQNMINSTTLLMQSYENIASELTNRPQNQDCSFKKYLKNI